MIVADYGFDRNWSCPDRPIVLVAVLGVMDYHLAALPRVANETHERGSGIVMFHSTELRIFQRRVNDVQV